MTKHEQHCSVLVMKREMKMKKMGVLTETQSRSVFAILTSSSTEDFPTEGHHQAGLKMIIIPAAKQIHCDDHLVRYHIPGINPTGAKSPFLLLELIANHSVTFHGAGAVSWVHLVQLSVAWWFIWSPLSYSVRMLASLIHTPSFPSPTSSSCLSYILASLIFPSSHPCAEFGLPLPSSNGLVHHAGAQ